MKLAGESSFVRSKAGVNERDFYRLLVVTDAHRDRVTAQRLEGPADLVIEIASDGDPGFDEREKLPRYRAAGIPEIWLISPQTHSVRLDQVDAQGLYRTSRLRVVERLTSTAKP